MQEHYNLKLDAYVMGDEMVEAIGSYFLHFNQNVADDINYRTFETSGCRTALLTNYTTNLEKLFDLDKEMLVYRNETELYSLLDKYLEDKQYLLKMGDLAYRNASQNHTYTNRCQRIIDILS
jgi:spore maturation protein CgeB